MAWQDDVVVGSSDHPTGDEPDTPYLDPWADEAYMRTEDA
jgi:hypothetical protein